MKHSAVTLCAFQGHLRRLPVYDVPLELWTRDVMEEKMRLCSSERFLLWVVIGIVMMGCFLLGSSC